MSSKIEQIITEIEEYIASVDDKSSKNTIIRDLDVLLKNNYIKKIGSARSIKYQPAKYNGLYFFIINGQNVSHIKLNN